MQTEEMTPVVTAEDALEAGESPELIAAAMNTNGNGPHDDILNVEDAETKHEPQTYAGRVFAEQNKDGDDTDVDFVFDGPFDPKRALDEIFRLNRVTEEARKDYERAKRQANELRTLFEDAAKAQGERLKEIEQWERGELAMQPRLKTLTDEQRADENIEERCARLTEQLQAKNCFISRDELRNLERVDLDTLDSWLQMGDGVVPPELLAKAHVAEEHTDGPGQTIQPCTRCDLVLHSTNRDGAWYPANAFVGLDCPGKPIESTRTTPKRRASKPRRKVDHDGERQAQAEAGAQQAQED